MEASPAWHFEYYENASVLAEFGKNLVSFPQHNTAVLLHEVGSERSEDNWSYYFRFRAFVIGSSGRCAIQIRFNNNQPLPDREQFEFCLRAEPTQLERLGKLYQAFSKLKDEVLEWSGNEGRLHRFAASA
jgi:hypothetical protein